MSGYQSLMRGPPFTLFPRSRTIDVALTSVRSRNEALIALEFIFEVDDFG
jgi:hypothetical protein